MEENRMKMQKCPLCHNHCPADSLSCSKGKKHFAAESGGKPTKESADGKHEEKKHPKDRHGKEYEKKQKKELVKEHGKKQEKEVRKYEQKDDLYSLLRSCGHYLHHSAGRGEARNETSELFSALDKQQREELKAYLKILRESWKEK